MKYKTNQVAQNKLQIKSAKNYFASLILLLGLFFSFTQSGNALMTCPSGFTNTTIYIPYGGCTYAVNLCYRCGITGADPTNVIYEYPVIPPGCPSIPESVIINKIISDYAYFCTVPPCDGTQTKRFVLETATCRKWVNQTSVDENNVIHHNTFSVICGDAGCITEFDVCRDYTTIPPSWQGTLFRKYRVGTRCTVSESNVQIPPPGKTWDDDWESECAEYNPCN